MIVKNVRSYVCTPTLSRYPNRSLVMRTTACNLLFYLQHMQHQTHFGAHGECCKYQHSLEAPSTGYTAHVRCIHFTQQRQEHVQVGTTDEFEMDNPSLAFHVSGLTALMLLRTRMLS